MAHSILSGLGLPTPADLIATENVEAIEQLQALAYTDGLTGVLNRRSFDLLAPRQGPDAAFLFVDLDDLKAKNQALGHLVSNELLKVAGQALARHMR
jgi:diguanylate cyclase (GGDEF)-like protein